MGNGYISVPLFQERRSMDNKQFNAERHNRKKHRYRFILGIQQLWNYPVFNLIWVLFAVGVVILAIIEEKYIENIDVYPMLETVFSACMKIIIFSFSIICVIGLVQLIGFCFAIKDEADIELVFGDKRDVNNQLTMLIYKKKDRKSRVIKREFYTTIPMEQWQEKKDDICDRMNIHLIGDITYGGRKKNKGNHIYFESAKGRNINERGVLYDDTL